MNHTGRFPYAETDSAQILELPYAGGSLAFDVILPKAGATLATLEEAFAGNGLSAWVGQLHPRQVQVALPKFRAEAQFALKPALSALGMGLAFSDSADFSGMAGRRDLTISEVVHKAFLDVSEEGTVAAAATGAVMSLTAYAPPTAFRADHPFLFLIRDTVAGTVLFAGRLTAPQR
jgi:serpin B